MANGTPLSSRSTGRRARSRSGTTGVQVSQQSVSGLDTSPVTGIFFSTFFGGSDNTWGPGHDVQAYYANFAVDTAYIGP